MTVTKAYRIGYIERRNINATPKNNCMQPQIFECTHSLYPKPHPSPPKQIIVIVIKKRINK
jgi:hypothetical protein